jgi:hypothetical protein
MAQKERQCPNPLAAMQVVRQARLLYGSIFNCANDVEHFRQLKNGPSGRQSGKGTTKKIYAGE